MEKLIEYLNAYEEEMGNGDIHTKVNRTDRRVYCYELDIISKRERFIERLLENDKINYDEDEEDWSENNLKWNADYFNLIRKYPKDKALIMLLSIQDNPIDFLISILK